MKAMVKTLSHGRAPNHAMSRRQVYRPLKRSARRPRRGRRFPWEGVRSLSFHIHAFPFVC